MLFCHNIHYILMIKRIFVPESCRRDLRTFSANISGLKNSPRQSFRFLDVWLRRCIFVVKRWKWNICFWEDWAGNRPKENGAMPRLSRLLLGNHSQYWNWADRSDFNENVNQSRQKFRGCGSSFRRRFLSAELGAAAKKRAPETLEPRIFILNSKLSSIPDNIALITF